MDLSIVYTGAIPLDSDILKTNLNAMKAFGHLARALYGDTAVAAGLDCTPNSPANLNFRIGPGMVTQATAIASGGYGSLAADNNQTIKIGGKDDVTTYPVVAPSTAGRTVCYLIQAAFDEQDTDAVVLPYRNAANPSQPFSGPNNSGTAQPTTRRQSVTIQAKRGTEAATGSEAVPAVSAGYLPLWIVRVSTGQSSVTASYITPHPDAPWVSKLTNKFAPIASPLFTGNPRGPAPSTSDSLVTKAYADSILSGAGVSAAADPNTIAKRTAAGALVATSFIGKATSAGAADTAASSTTAQNAARATEADHAANADNAINAVNAQTAVTAGSAGTAATATTATTATNANKLDNKSPSVVTAADTVVVRDPAGNISANVFNGRAASANYADYAERFMASEPLEPGDVVSFGGQHEICKAGMTHFFGVVSTAPAYLTNDIGNDETHPPVALKGRVPVKVLGPIEKFDLLVMSSIPGVAYAAKDAVSVDVIGRALEAKSGDGVKLVLAYVQARI